MSELNDDIDKLFREVIDTAEMQPPPMVWASIENNLDKTKHLKLQKKLNRLITYSVSSSVVIVSLVSVLWYKEYHSKNEVATNNIASNTVESKSIVPATVANTNIVNQLPIVKSSSENTSEKKIISEKRNEEQNAIPEKSQQISPVAKEQENKIAANVSLNKNISLPEKLPISDINITSNKNDEQDVKPAVIENNVASSIEPAKQNSLPDELLNSTTQTKELIKKNEQNKVLKSDSIAETAKPIVSPLTVKGADTAKTTSPLLPIKDFKFFVGAIYSPEKAMTNFINTKYPTSQIQETQHYSYSTGVRFGYKFYKNWSIATNIVFSQTYKSFSYYQATLEHDDDDHDKNVNKELATSYGVIDFPSNYVERHPTGGQHPHHDGDTLIIDIKGMQKLTYLTIPVSCQYQITKNRLNGIFSLGVSTSILLTQSAEITYANLDTKYVTKINGLQNLYFNGIIGVGVQYRIFNRLSVFMQPAFSQAFTSMNKNTPYKTYPSSFSGSAGINFHF